MNRRILGILLALVLLGSAGCGGASGSSAASAQETLRKYGSNYRADMETPEDGHLFGMCYLAWEGIGNGIDYQKALQLMKNLGVQSIRHWMHFSYYMEDYQTFKPEAVEQMHDILAAMREQGFQVIGMSHVNWSLKFGRFGAGKPVRQPWEGSDYYRWLECYEETWYLVAEEFPEITYWEIDNEINNKDFMYTEGKFGEKLSTQELAALSADMLFYASRGIHRANPNAVTVMGGIVDPLGLGIPETDTGTTMVNFMEALYDAIESGDHGSFYPDDFFQVAAWHPYYYQGKADDYFVQGNNRIYEVIRRREGKDKKVFLTEFGWNESIWGEENIVEAMRDLYTVIAEQMPYVESLHYFRAFDNISNNGELAGMFYDPNPGRIDVMPGSDVRRTPGAPKPCAYAYQQAAGGMGSLDVLMTPAENP